MDLVEAIAEYKSKIIDDYESWGGAISPVRQKMIEEFKNGITVDIGRKYAKVITTIGGRSVHSFIVIVHDDKKFKYGDILKAASWASPARNSARGNIFGKYTVKWTGANYL